MHSDLRQALRKASDMRVLVIGEATLDVDLQGVAARLAREAPVPIVEVERQTWTPGRAANTAVNVASLGARTTLLSVIGDDEDGMRLLDLLVACGVDARRCVVDGSWRTRTVSRVMAGGQLVTRFDTGADGRLTSEANAALLAELRNAYALADVVLVSDYGHGVLNDEVIGEIAELQRRYNKTLLIDSKYLSKYRDIRATAIKPNYQEALELLGLGDVLPPGGRSEQLELHREALLAKTGAACAVVTLDSEGTVVIRADDENCYRTQSKPVKSTKAVGAGDTFSAALAIGLGSGLDALRSTELAQAAASVVLQQTGTASCSKEELLRSLDTDSKFIAHRAQLQSTVQQWRRQGKRIVFTNGCFDILHSGHIACLALARSYGDVLIVGLNNDTSIRSLKGAGRPVNTLKDRARVLCGLADVDAVVAFGGVTAERLVAAIRPDVYVKGGDYTVDSLPEAAMVARFGGRTAIIPLVPDYSTTEVIARAERAAER